MTSELVHGCPTALLCCPGEGQGLLSQVPQLMRDYFHHQLSSSEDLRTSSSSHHRQWGVGGGGGLSLTLSTLWQVKGGSRSSRHICWPVYPCPQSIWSFLLCCLSEGQGWLFQVLQTKRDMVSSSTLMTLGPAFTTCSRWQRVRDKGDISL